MTTAKRTSKYGIRSTALTLGILEHLASSPYQRGITDLARALGTSKWRLFRHVHALREEGYVIQDAQSERFELGTRFYLLTRALPERFRFVDMARPAMLDLHAKISHMTVIAALINGKMVVLDTTSTNEDEPPLLIAHGKAHDLHASAHGKVALAYGPTELLETTLSSPLKRYTRYTITQPEKLKREVALVRQRGWAAAFEEGPRSGMNTTSAPIFSADTKFAGSIGFIVPGPAKAIRSRPLASDVASLVDAARTISRRLLKTMNGV
jgi:DNA-binding IclR family transcriptional regulator